MNLKRYARSLTADAVVFGKSSMSRYVRHMSDSVRYIIEMILPERVRRRSPSAERGVWLSP